MSSAALPMAAPAMTPPDSVKPGTCAGNISSAPMTKAAMPPTPSAPKAPMWASATMRATPSSTSATPA